MLLYLCPGIQKVDGLQGSLIVRQAKQDDPNGALYDEDLPAHVIFVTDWFHTDSDQHYPGLRNPDSALYATYFLINGRGRMQASLWKNNAFLFTTDLNSIQIIFFWILIF